MTQDPGYPAFETALEKPQVGPAQSALDATFNAHENGPLSDVEARLREELERAGAQGVPEEWISRMAGHVRAGEPVVVEVNEAPPG
jgi:hypothetical protein